MGPVGCCALLIGCSDRIGVQALRCSADRGWGQLEAASSLDWNSPTGSTLTAFSTFINTRGLMRI